MIGTPRKVSSSEKSLNASNIKWLVRMAKDDHAGYEWIRVVFVLIYPNPITWLIIVVQYYDHAVAACQW